MQVAGEFNFGPWQSNINSVEREAQIELRLSFFFLSDRIQFQTLPQNIFLFIYFNCLKNSIERQLTYVLQDVRRYDYINEPSRCVVIISDIHYRLKTRQYNQ